MMNQILPMEDQDSLTFKNFLSLFDLPMVGLDTETTTSRNHPNDDFDIRDGSGHANGVSIGARIGSIPFSHYFPFRHCNAGGDRGNNLGKVELLQLKERLESYDGYLVFHNAKFDLVSLHTLGINYTGKFYCTMEIAHLLNEERPYSKDLDSVASFYGVAESKKKSDIFLAALKHYGWKNIPPSVLKEYAAQDALLTFDIMTKMLPLMDNDLVKYWHEQKMPFYKVIIAMESLGVKVDVDLCKRMTALGENAMEDVKEILQLNPGSPKDLEELLINKLELPVVKKSVKTGKPSFDKEAMAEYETMLELRNDSTAEYILTYRGWQKSVSSNYKAYVELLSSDGRLRPNYKLHGTKTGRMSCEKPNLQQIPRVSDKSWNGEMKNCFIPEVGFKLWEADYGQLELRLATAYCDERELKRVFDEDRDVFTEMSQQLRMVRHETKTLTYTIQYGGGINRISTVFGVNAAHATSLRENFYSTYPKFRAKSVLAQRKAASKGKLQLWSGRYRHFLRPKDEAHKAFNSIIQGGAADIVERTMIRLFNQVHGDDCRMLLQVHDSVVFEIREGMEDHYLPLIKEVMTNVEPDFGVKFAVDIHEWGT
jgi:DNA polymerase-1